MILIKNSKIKQIFQGRTRTFQISAYNRRCKTTRAHSPPLQGPAFFHGFSRCCCHLFNVSFCKII